MIEQYQYITISYVIGNNLERKKRKKLIKQMQMTNGQQPLISKESRSGKYPSADGDIRRFDVPDEYVSFDVSLIALFNSFHFL